MSEQERQEKQNNEGQQDNSDEREKLPAPVDRRRVLDAEKRRKILAVAANGGSLRSAARYVGCSHSTILRAVDRDPEFAEQVGHALQNVEIEALYNIRKAARKERHWRTAAWLLERTNNKDYGPRPPRTFTAPEVATVAAQFISLMSEVIPAENVDYALARMDAIIDFLDREEELPKSRQLPAPGVVLDDDGDDVPWWLHFDEACRRTVNQHPPGWLTAPIPHAPPAGESCTDEEVEEGEKVEEDAGPTECAAAGDGQTPTDAAEIRTTPVE